MDPRYVLDSNIFIEAKNTWYGFQICPGYWELLERGLSEGLLVSHEKVRNELLNGNDELAEWVAGLDKAYFPSASSRELDTFLSMSKWVKSKDYKPAAIATFDNPEIADGWLCAKAAVEGLTVVSHEVSSPTSKKSVKVPDVCNAFGVRHIMTYGLVAELQAAFQLESAYQFPV